MTGSQKLFNAFIGYGLGKQILLLDDRKCVQLTIMYAQVQ